MKRECAHVSSLADHRRLRVRVPLVRSREDDAVLRHVLRFSHDARAREDQLVHILCSTVRQLVDDVEDLLRRVVANKPLEAIWQLLHRAQLDAREGHLDGLLRGLLRSSCFLSCLRVLRRVLRCFNFAVVLLALLRLVQLVVRLLLARALRIFDLLERKRVASFHDGVESCLLVVVELVAVREADRSVEQLRDKRLVMDERLEVVGVLTGVNGHRLHHRANALRCHLSDLGDLRLIEVADVVRLLLVAAASPGAVRLAILRLA